MPAKKKASPAHTVHIKASLDKTSSPQKRHVAHASPKKAAPAFSMSSSDEEEVQDSYEMLPHHKQQVLPADFNFDMQARNEELADQNSALARMFEEKEQTISTLSEALLAMEEDLRVARDGDPTGEMVKEYMKKNHSLNAQLAKQRSLVYKAKQETATVRKELDDCLQTLEAYEGNGMLMMNKDAMNRKDPVPDTRKDSSTKLGGKFGPGFEETNADKQQQEDAKYWRAKYNRSKSRGVDARNAMTNLKNELNKTRLALQREVGDNINLDAVINSSKDTYRSRAEENSILAAKVKKLQRKLREVQGPSMGDDPNATFMQQTRQEQHLAALSQERNKQIEELINYKNAVDDDLAKTQSKLSSSRARVKALDKQVGQLKENLQVMLDAKANDDELIHELHKELSKVTSKTHQQSQAQLQDKARRHGHLQEEVAKQKNEIRYLENELKQMRASKRFDQDELAQRVELLEQEVEAKTKLAKDLQGRDQKQFKQIAMLTNANAELEAKLSVASKKNAASGKVGRSENQSLKIRLKKAQNANVQLTEAYREHLQGKEQTLQVLQNLLSQQKIGYATALNNIKAKMSLGGDE